MNLKEHYEKYLESQITPILVADKLANVQPMTAPTGKIFKFNRINTTSESQKL